MTNKRKQSFHKYLKGKLSVYNHVVAKYANDIKLSKAEKTVLADYMNGHVSLHALTPPMLTKLLGSANNKLQFKKAYALELIANNLSEQSYDVLCRLYKEDTLRKWMSEQTHMSVPMQEIYLSHFGYTAFEGSKLATVHGGIDMSNRVVGTKPVPQKNKQVGPAPTAPDATNFREQQARHTSVEVEDKDPSAADYFSEHVMRRIGKRLQEMFEEVMDYHHDEEVPSLFKEFAKSQLSQLMADYWWETFQFKYVDFKGDDNTLKASCKHFDVFLSHKEITFVDKWHLGDVSYTIPTSNKLELRMEQASYFFQTWDSRRIRDIFQHIGFEQEDELLAAGKPIDVHTQPCGPQALMEMNKGSKPISWDGAVYTVYDTLGHMRDGVRGVIWDVTAKGDYTLRVGGLEYATVIVSEGPVKRYVMNNLDARSFFNEYTDHMGFDINADELRQHGFALSLDTERAVLSFNDDKERACEIIVYV